MFRLSVLLSACLFTTLLIAGTDKGQMRPGLARATAEGTPIVTVSRSYSAPVQLAEAEPEAPSSALPAPVRPVAPAAKPRPVAAVQTADAATPAPVFTLAALTGLGGDQARLTEVSPATVNDDAPSHDDLDTSAVDVAGLDASIWYVNASAVNVRQSPSTGAPVVERLIEGEAVTVLGDTSGDWVRITIQGDGVDGWIATRLLARY